jgi:hypothetical protein
MGMGDTRILDLEAAVKAIPGVLGCVILLRPDGSSGEIQAFSKMGEEREALQHEVVAQIEKHGFSDKIKVVHVFELDAESLFGDMQTLERAAELAEQDARTKGPLAIAEETPQPADPPGTRRAWHGEQGLKKRPLLQRVVLSASSHSTEAEVALGATDDEQVVGLAAGEKTPHGLMVVGEATLEACRQLVPGFDAELRGASLVTVVGEEAVLSLVRLDGQDLIGAALLRGGPASEAAVRATLDAINRTLLRQG